MHEMHFLLHSFTVRFKVQEVYSLCFTVVKKKKNLAKTLYFTLSSRQKVCGQCKPPPLMTIQ